jgi:hypothetical protein
MAIKPNDRFALTAKGRKAVDAWGPEHDKPMQITLTDKGRKATAEEAFDSSKE